MSQPAADKHPTQKQPNTDSKMKTQTGAIEQLNVKTTNAHPHRLWVSILVAAFVVLFCEVGLFNLGYWRTFHNPAAVVGKPVIGEGLEARGNSDYTVTNPEKATITVPVSSPDGQPVRVRSVRVIATPTDRPMVEGQENLYSPAELLFNIVDADSGETASHSTEGNAGSTSNSSKTEKVDATEDQEHWGSSTHSDGAWGDINNTLNYTTNPASHPLQHPPMACAARGRHSVLLHIVQTKLAPVCATCQPCQQSAETCHGGVHHSVVGTHSHNRYSHIPEEYAVVRSSGRQLERLRPIPTFGGRPLAWTHLARLASGSGTWPVAESL